MMEPFPFGPDDAASLGSLEMSLRAIAVYVGGLVLVRIGRNRMLGRTSAFDIVLGFLLGSLLSRAINGSAPLVPTFASAAALVALHWIVAHVAHRVAVLDPLLKGARLPLVKDGRILPANLHRGEISERDLAEAMRLHGRVDSVEQVRHAYLERNGEISVIPR